jgi:hypothetical protein
MATTGAGYYQNNLLTEIAALKARVAVLERALLASRATATAGAMEGWGMAADTPTSALPAAADIPPVYFVDYETSSLYRGLVRTVEGRARFYLQRVGRVRMEGE